MALSEFVVAPLGTQEGPPPASYATFYYAGIVEGYPWQLDTEQSVGDLSFLDYGDVLPMFQLEWIDEGTQALVQIGSLATGDLPNLYDRPAIVPAAVSSQLDDTGEERIHIAHVAPVAFTYLPPPPPPDTATVYTDQVQYDVRYNIPATITWPTNSTLFAVAYCDASWPANNAVLSADFSKQIATGELEVSITNHVDGVPIAGVDVQIQNVFANVTSEPIAPGETKVFTATVGAIGALSSAKYLFNIDLAYDVAGTRKYTINYAKTTFTFS